MEAPFLFGWGPHTNRDPTTKTLYTLSPRYPTPARPSRTLSTTMGLRTTAPPQSSVLQMLAKPPPSKGLWMGSAQEPLRARIGRPRGALATAGESAAKRAWGLRVPDFSRVLNLIGWSGPRVKRFSIWERRGCRVGCRQGFWLMI